MSVSGRRFPLPRLLPCLSLVLPMAGAMAAEDGGGTGKPILDLRYRYEQVDPDNAQPTAHAHTLRTRLGYQTAAWQGLSARVEFDHVAHLGDARFNDTRNGRTGYPTVADPDGGAINQALLRYAGRLGSVQVGRQRINLDNQRFIGGVAWRQNEQTYDGAQAEWTPTPHWRLGFAWIGRIHTVFGPDDTSPASATAPAEIAGRSQIWHAQYEMAPALTAVAYQYRLGLDNIAVGAGAPPGTLSSRTRGLRLQGRHADLAYALEYARQQDLDGNPWALDSRYWLAELAYTARGVQWKLGQEVLGAGEGAGNRAFQTPLATKHLFQGWADQFLTTPADGLRDRYLGAGGALAGGQWQAMYHDYRGDRGGVDFGRELDLSCAHAIPLLKGLSGLVKYAGYRSDDRSRSADTDKLWLQVQYSY